jgi:hypothetical protein
MTTATFTPDSHTAMTQITGTGFNNPITGAETQFTGTGFTLAGGISDVQSSDNVYATAAPANNNGLGHLFMFSTLASQIPAGATITSCQLIVEKKYSTTSSGGALGICAFASRSGGVPSGKIGSQQNDGGVNAENTTDADLTLTFSPSASQLRGSGFCVGAIFARQSLTGYTGSIDYVRLVVTWNEPGGGGRGKPSIGPTVRPAVASSLLSPILPPRSGVLSGKKRSNTQLD